MKLNYTLVMWFDCCLTVHFTFLLWSVMILLQIWPPSIMDIKGSQYCNERYIFGF
jgi:hypothetical protein